ADVELDGLWEGETRLRVELPTYAFAHKPYFIEPGKARAPESDELAKIPELERWGWKPRYRPALADPREPSGERHTWLVFVDRGGIGRRIKERLEARGDRVIVVHEGDAYGKRGELEYSLSPERGREGYAALIADLVQAGAAPDRILHLWLLETETSFRPGSSLFHHHQERGFFSLFFLAQALGESLAAPLHITVVANGMQRVSDEPLPHPDKATVLGPVKVIPRELTGVSASLIDVALPARSERLFAEGLRMALADP